jgi:hypothetical protein
MNGFKGFIIGLLCGLLLPVGVVWLYLNNFNSNEEAIREMLKVPYSSIVLGKLLLLSIVPDLLLAFIFYKRDSFKLGGGVLLGAIPYLVASILMFN